MNIAVFVFAYPVLSETFVINELFQLQEAGVRGAIWREKEAAGSAHPKVGQLNFPLFTCPPKILSSLTPLLKDHLWWLTNYTLRYFKLLIEVTRSFPDLESLKIWCKAASVARQVFEQKSNLVYVHESDRAFVFGLCSARLCNLPLVVIFHTYYLFVEKRYVEQKVIISAAAIFQSKYSQQLVAELVHQHPALVKKMFVVSSPGIDTTFFRPATLKKESTEMKLVSVGRLEEAKGFEYLVEAVALLKQRGIPVQCQIVGEGSYRSKLEKLISSKKVEQEVALLGSLPHGRELQKALWAADFFVLPSVQDSQGVHDVHPNAVKEAMAAELLTVTTRLGGIDEVIEDGEDGFLIESADPKLIADTLERVAQLPLQQRLAVRRAARKKIVKLYGSEEVTSHLLKIFKNYAT